MESLTEELIRKELSLAEKSLAEVERKQQQQLENRRCGYSEELEGKEFGAVHILKDLVILEKTAESLQLTQDIAEWMESIPTGELRTFFKTRKFVRILRLYY